MWIRTRETGRGQCSGEVGATGQRGGESAAEGAVGGQRGAQDAAEQPVQEHTRIVTDAKKREYPDRPGTIPEKLLEETVSGGIWHNRGCGLW